MLPAVDPVDAKEVAKAKLKASSASPRDLAQTKLEAARWAYLARERNLLAGMGTLDILLEDACRVLDSELALADRAADRRAALEKYWLCTARTEEVYRLRHEAGRVAIQDYLQSRYFRLDAEIRLAEVQTKRAPKEK